MIDLLHSVTPLKDHTRPVHEQPISFQHKKLSDHHLMERDLCSDSLLLQRTALTIFIDICLG